MKTAGKDRIRYALREVIFLGAAALLLLIVVVLSMKRGGAGIYAAACGVPLFLTVVAPLPFAFIARSPAGWPRRIVLALTWSGVGASAILLIVGVVLTWRAASRGDHRGAMAFGLEAIVAGLPGIVVAAYALVFRVL